MQFTIVTVASVVALFVGQGAAQGLDACASGCVNGVFLNAVGIGCTDNDRLCVCGKTAEFSDGIRDCVNQVCGGDAAAQLPLAQTYGTGQCESASSAAGLLPTPVPTTSPSPAPAQPTEATVPTQVAASAAPPSPTAETSAETTPTPVASSNAVSSDVTSDALTAVAATTDPATSASATAIESAATESSVPSSSPESSSTSSETASSAQESDQGTSSTAAPVAPASNDLSVAARAGIGAAAGVVIAMIGLVIGWLCLRRRNANRAKKQMQQFPAMQISQPLPGSGRQFADNMRQTEAGLSKSFTPTARSEPILQPTRSHPSGPPSPTGSYSSQLDANARRYEDLLPRTQPRTMI
ncbi:hypothetical protein F4819DRAFT_148841 [Hypoxylon fuscum]|nr:hypothetical protein F4819DRAFT_148841 [Hypoxylon fuscum]